jgi:hypothetical protein
VCTKDLKDKFHEVAPQVSEWSEIGLVAFQTDRLTGPYPGGKARLAIGRSYRLGVLGFKVTPAAGTGGPKYERHGDPRQDRSPVTVEVPALASGERFLLLISVQVPQVIYQKGWGSPESGDWKAVKDLIDLPSSAKDLAGIVNLRIEP